MKIRNIRSCWIWDKNGKKKEYRASRKPQRMYNLLHKGNFSKIYFKIEYGKAKTSSGKLEMFYNDGTYENPKEALQAFRAFME